MRVLIASPDKDEIQKVAIPALESAGASVLGYCISADSLADKVKALQPDLVVLRVDLARQGEEESLLSLLNVPVAAILPRGRGNLREALAAHPNVRCVAVLPDVDYVQLVARRDPATSCVAGDRAADDRARVILIPPALASSESSAASGPRRRALCLVLVGVKGGVGTTTAACALAAAAGALKLRVGVVDLTGTGDARVTLPAGAVSVLEPDRAELARQWFKLRAEHDLLLVDAGRLPLLPAQWIGAITVIVTRADTTDRLPSDPGGVIVTQADRAPVGLKAMAVLPSEPDLYEQIAGGRFLQPGPLWEAATEWANTTVR